MPTPLWNNDLGCVPPFAKGEDLPKFDENRPGSDFAGVAVPELARIEHLDIPIDNTNAV